MGGRFGAELRGAGDVLRLGDTHALKPMLRRAIAWRALEFDRVGVLDDTINRCMGRYPGVLVAADA